LSKKNLFLVIFILLIFAGFIALTQEMEFNPENIDTEKENEITIVIKPARWFISNKGGMAVEETFSKAIAMRNEYALSIENVNLDKVPFYLLSFYETGFIPELRILYKNEIRTRTQWLFRDKSGFTRMNSVFTELDDLTDDEINLLEADGFIELFDINSYLISEYRFYKNGKGTRIEYTYDKNVLTSCEYFIQDEIDKEQDLVISYSIKENIEKYKPVYTDVYRYNRSSSLRAIERLFYVNMQIVFDDTVLISFPRNAMRAAREGNFISERLNKYSGFFGDVYSENNFKLVYETDERGRILSQSYVDNNGKIIWEIKNVWLNNRIASSVKTEGDTVLLAEYEYDQNGDRLIERNYKNGMLERLVNVEGNIDIEELYFNNILVLRAVWEDGRKISETRVR